MILAGSPRSTSFINFFHMGAIFCFFLVILMFSVNNLFFRWTNRHSQFGTFFHPRPNRTSLNCLSHKKSVHWIFNVWSSSRPCVSWKTYPYNMDILTLEFWPIFGASSMLTWMWGITASAAYPAQSGSLAMTSVTVVAANWHADAPCSLNALYEPESFSTMSPRSTTRPFVLLILRF